MLYVYFLVKLCKLVQFFDTMKNRVVSSVVGVLHHLLGLIPAADKNKPRCIQSLPLSQGNGKPESSTMPRHKA